MSNQDKYKDIGNRIQQSVSDALASGDFSKLNEDITSSVRTVLSDVGDQINMAFSSSNPGARAYRDTAAQDIERHQQRREELRQRALQARNKSNLTPDKRVKFNAVGQARGVLDIVGGSLLFLSGIAGTIVIGIINTATEATSELLGLGVAGSGIAPWPLLFSAAGIVLGSLGIGRLQKVGYAKKLRKLCSEKLYIGVDAIANATGLSKKKTIKKIKKVLEKGFFPEGYLDAEETTFMVSKEIYDKYLETKENQIVIEAQNTAMESAEGKLNAMIAEGMRYKEKLSELNDRIPGVVITEKLNKLESLLKEIFNGLREHPDQMDSCHKLMDYYLPTMIKLVEAYAEYDKVSQPGPEIIAAKQEIENTLDIINQAFVELLNKLYQSSVWDVTAEAKVLKTMLNQAGLTEGNKKTVAEEVVEEEEEVELNPIERVLEENVVNRV